jgi:hypothetical protein
MPAKSSGAKFSPSNTIVLLTYSCGHHYFNTYSDISVSGNAQVVIGDKNYFGLQERLKCVESAEFNSYGQVHAKDKYWFPPTRLIDYLPKSKRGCVIFTTRDRKAAV